MAEVTKLKEGQKAPSFKLKNQEDKLVSLEDFKGQKVLVYFYPKDDTPGCTKEACQFRDNLSSFKKLKIPVVGISKDSVESHVKFARKYNLTFDLLSDPESKVAAKYGAFGEKSMYGKKTVGTIRSTFLISEDGKILKAWYNVKADGHPEAVFKYLEENS